MIEAHRCKDCGGTGKDAAKTKARPAWECGYVVCNNCRGNGWDPAEVFLWGPYPEPKVIGQQVITCRSETVSKRRKTVTTKYAYEYGERWNPKTPRWSIARRVDALHVGLSDEGVTHEIEAALEGVGREFTASIKRQCIQYALIRHHKNQDLYRNVVRGR